MEKMLGKISSAQITLGGRGDDYIGLCLGFKMGMAATSAFYGFYAGPQGKDGVASPLDEVESLIERTANLMAKAKVNSIAGLVGAPVEVTAENGEFKDFRILEEVL